MLLHQAARRLAHPLEQAEVLELVRAEDLKHFNVLLVRQVLDEVAHVARHDTHVAGLVVEGARGSFGGEDGDARAAFDEEGPFVCVGFTRSLAREV
jgi:acid stress-induced BolA-like protein IbaG/YrbA